MRLEDRFVRIERAQQDDTDELGGRLEEVEQVLILGLEVLARRRLPSPEDRCEWKWKRFKPLVERFRCVLLDSASQPTGQSLLARCSTCEAALGLAHKLASQFRDLVLQRHDRIVFGGDVRFHFQRSLLGLKSPARRRVDSINVFRFSLGMKPDVFFP